MTQFAPAKAVFLGLAQMMALVGKLKFQSPPTSKLMNHHLQFRPLFTERRKTNPKEAGRLLFQQSTRTQIRARNFGVAQQKSERGFMIHLEELKKSTQVVDDLAWPYDFDLSLANADTSWITLRPSVKFHVLAGDGAGGVFLTYGEGTSEDFPVLHATSEGQAGKIANSLQDAVALHIQLPYWRDLLKFSGDGDLAQMRRASPFLESEYSEDMPELTDAKTRLLAALDVPVLDDPIAYLHQCIRGTDCTLVADDGGVWESLFNSFTIDQNRSWQQWTAQQSAAADGQKAAH